MTKKEKELRIANLEKSVSDLAKKQSDRDNRNEDKITAAGMSIDSLDSRSTNMEADIADTQDALCEQSAATDKSISVIEDAMCESELLTDDRLASIEDALCELSTMMS